MGDQFKSFEKEQNKKKKEKRQLQKNSEKRFWFPIEESKGG